MDTGIGWISEIESCYSEVTTHEKLTKRGFKRTGVVVEYDYENDPEVYTYAYQTYLSSDIMKTAQMLCENGFKTRLVKKYVTFLENSKTQELCYLSLKSGVVEFLNFEEV